MSRRVEKSRFLIGFLLAALIAVFGADRLPAAESEFTILAIGDSLTAGYNLPRAAAFPAQLERRLRDDGLDVRVRNAGVSGDTTAMGLSRLDWVLEGGKPDMAIVELGANDALRGVAPKKVRANLSTMIERLQAAEIPVLLAGMRAPRNMGSDYVKAFDSIFPELAEKYDTAFYPFFLKDVIQNPDLVQSDGLHPTKKGVAVIIENIAPRVRAMIRDLKATETG